MKRTIGPSWRWFRPGPVSWILLLVGGALVLVVLAGREADRAGRTADVLMRDYAEFIAERFVRTSADRYASLVGMRSAGAEASPTSPFAAFRRHSRAWAAGQRPPLPAPAVAGVRYVFLYDRAAGPIEFAGTPPASAERAHLRQVIATQRLSCEPERTFVFGRLSSVAGPAKGLSVDWSALAFTDGQGSLRRVYGLRLDEHKAVDAFLKPVIEPDDECDCPGGLLPEGLAGIGDALRVASFTLDDASGATAYRSAPAYSGPTVRRALSPELPLPGWTVSVSMNPVAVRPLLPYEGRSAPWTLLGVLAVLVAGSALLAIQSLRRSARLQRLREDFVSNVSHELKTPLARVRLFNELLLTSTERPAGRRAHYRRVIDRECRRLTFLVDNVLDFSRNERAPGSRAPRPLDLRPVVEAALESFRAASEHGHRGLVACLDDVPPVSGDSEALARVLINLLDNAFKYAPEGSPVEVRLKAVNGSVHMSVRDSGPGIPPREQERVFEEFYRANHASGDGPAGTGLGLALVRRTVTSHGGRVHLESQVGAGSVFTVELPALAGTTADRAGGEAS